ncbi:MAG: hypothetical protein CL912_12155 [Deltaproteobacteria bacterium]|nr:hypothetical protein [Deltaproteobacteria bacterium]
MEQERCISGTEVAKFAKETTSTSRKGTTDPDIGAIIHSSKCDSITPVQAKSESVAMAKDATAEVSKTSQESEKSKSVQVSKNYEDEVTMKGSEQAILIVKSREEEVSGEEEYREFQAASQSTQELLLPRRSGVGARGQELALNLELASHLEGVSFMVWA